MSTATLRQHKRRLAARPTRVLNFGKQPDGKMLVFTGDEAKECEVTPEIEFAVQEKMLEVVEAKPKKKPAKKSTKKAAKKD